MATPNLNITHIVTAQAQKEVTAQAQKEVTANEAFDALDAALCGELSLDFTAGNVALTDAQFRGSIAFRATNLSVARDLTVPAVKRLFVVSNKDGTNTLTVKRGATSVALAAGKLALLYTDGTTDGLFAAAADSGAGAVTSVFTRTGAVVAAIGDYNADQISETAGNKIMTAAERSKLGKVLNLYQLAGSLPGAPTSSQRVFHHLAVAAFTLPQNLTGSAGKAKTQASAQTDFDLQVNGVSNGTMRWAAAGTTASFICAADVSVAAGDEIEIIAPASADATLANLVWTLKGTL
jgi:hypothetical protein